MSEFILYQQMLTAPELNVAMTGSSVFIGTLLNTPIKLIFSNQSTSPVVLSTQLSNGGMVQWKTFSPGETLVLNDDFYTFPRGMSFYGNGAATGNFSIAYTYINNF
jgi:hypothetical protein